MPTYLSSLTQGSSPPDPRIALSDFDNGSHEAGREQEHRWEGSAQAVGVAFHLTHGVFLVLGSILEVPFSVVSKLAFVTSIYTPAFGEIYNMFTLLHRSKLKLYQSFESSRKY